MTKNKKQKISLKEVKKLPISTLIRFINKAKKSLKSDETWQRMCKENDVDVDIIDLIPTKFGKLDVSAKTDHGVVILNYQLLCEGDFGSNYGYLIHEYTHWLQQCFGKTATQGADDGNYLHNKHEQEGFANQVEHIANNQGEEKAEEYVENLLEYHDVKDKQEKDELSAIFLEKVEE